jgi:hypothetical protein
LAVVGPVVTEVAGQFSTLIGAEGRHREAGGRDLSVAALAGLRTLDFKAGKGQCRCSTESSAFAVFSRADQPVFLHTGY